MIEPRKGMARIVFLLAGLTLFAAAAQESRRDTPPLVCVWAVQATYENREEPHFDRGLEEIRAAVSELRYDTYRNLNVARQRIALGEEARIRIDARYTLYITPISCDDDGLTRLQLRMEMQPRDPDKDPVNVLQSRQVLSPNQKMIIGGPRLDTGDLVIVLETRR